MSNPSRCPQSLTINHSLRVVVARRYPFTVGPYLSPSVVVKMPPLACIQVVSQFALTRTEKTEVLDGEQTYLMRKD